MGAPVNRAGNQAVGEAQGTRACPMCGEEILPTARLCKHCKSPLVPSGKRFKGRMRKRRSSGEGRSAIIFGILGLLFLVIPMVGLVLASVAVLYGNSARKNPEERLSGWAGIGLGLSAWVVVLAVVFILVAAAASR